MKHLLLFLIVLLPQIGFGQYPNFKDEDFKPFLQATHKGEKILSIDSIYKTEVAYYGQSSNSFIVLEKNSDYNITKAKMTNIEGFSLNSYDDSLVVEYFNGFDIRSYLVYTDFYTGIDTSKYLEYNEENLLVFEQYRYNLFCGTGSPNDEYKNNYVYDNHKHMIKKSSALKWNYECATRPYNQWIDNYDIEYQYKDNKLESEYHQSNYFDEREDTVYLQLFPYKLNSISYKDEKIDSIIYEEWDLDNSEWKDILIANYSYIADSVFIENSRWDDYYQKWVKDKRTITFYKNEHNNTIYQYWSSSKQEWINQSFTYYTSSPIPGYFNYYNDKWNTTDNKWSKNNYTEYNNSGDTIVETKFYGNNLKYKSLFLYDVQEKLVLKKKYTLYSGILKLDNETLNEYNSDDLLLKSTFTNYKKIAPFDTVKTILDYYWHTDFKEIPDYIPMLKKENQWNTMQTDATFGPNHTEDTWKTFTYSIEDTLIGNQMYSKLLSSEGEAYLLREDTVEKKVFLIETYNGNFDEKLIYDFGMEIGDTFDYYYAPNQIQFSLRLDSVKNITFDNGAPTRAYFLGVKWGNPDSYFHDKLVWIEGMGDIGKFFYGRCIGIVGCEIYNNLLCYKKNEELYYINPQFNTCFRDSGVNDELTNYKVKIVPNPVYSAFTIKTELDIVKVQIYDLNGKKLTSTSSQNINVNNLNPGLYIAKLLTNDGKFVVKKFVKE